MENLLSVIFDALLMMLILGIMIVGFLASYTSMILFGIGLGVLKLVLIECSKSWNRD